MSIASEASDGLTIDGDRFLVLVNDEGQYSIWPEDLAVPSGWTDTGERGDKAACIAWVDRTWLDMRPVSLRRAMDGATDGDADRAV